MPTDPYKYFRIEARELLEELGRGVLELERGPVSLELIGRMLRAAHTFKGASRVVKQNEIANSAHAIEDALTPHRTSEGPVPPERIQTLFSLLDAMKGAVSLLAPPLEARDGPATDTSVEERFRTVRVETSEMDKLLIGVTQASVQLAAMRSELQLLEQAESLSRELVVRLEAHAVGADAREMVGRLLSIAEGLQTTLNRHHRGFNAALDQVDREIREVGDTANALRLLPAVTIFTPLERAVRDAAQTLRKAVEFRTFGGETRLEAHVLSAVQDALLHVVRNAVAHGIEHEKDRVSIGKPPVGRVELRVARTGNRIVLTCTDDGRGIDVEAVRRAAAARRLVPAADLAALSPDQLAQLILKGGISTSSAPTEVSGRGIGLDVVRNTVARLQGELNVYTQPGRGTTFEMRVPFSLSSISALLAEASGITCCFPVDAVRAAVRIGHDQIVHTAEGASIMYQDVVIPFLPLAAALGQPLGSMERNWSVVILEVGGLMAAIGVDRMLGTSNIFLKPLPAWVAARPAISGASLDPSGDSWLVLDPAVLINGASAASWEVAATGSRRPPVLVVDDSLTTRMLEQSILESAGYEVDLATSGEEALQKARARRYGVMIVDVEMPGIDGFEVLSRAGHDPVLRDIPIILVTSRSAAEDLRRGKELGARAYIVKNEFDQKRLLSILRGLIG